MTLTQIICIAVCVAIAIVVIFAAVGGLNLSLPGGQIIPAALSGLIGVIAGNFVHKRCFGGR